MQPGKIPLGIFYREIRPTLEELVLGQQGVPIATLPIEQIDPKLFALQDAYA